MIVDIGKVKYNPKNPRIIKDYKFKKLVKSIKEFPEMLEKRPIVVDENMIVLGGNMRLKACHEAGFTTVHILKAENWSDKQKEEFIIKDNVGFGEWDWDILANAWDTKDLEDWGLDVWQPDEAIDYGVLDEVDLEDEIQTMYDQTKKSIILEYPAKEFETIKKIYEELKNKGVNLSDLFHQSMLNFKE